MKKLLLGATLLALGAGAWAQVNTATIVGTVRDASGAVIPACAVTAVNAETGLTITAATDNGGNYIFDRLPAGPYRLAAALEGFRTVERSGIRLDATQRVKIDITLEVGSVAEKLEVTAAAPVVNTQNTELGSVIGEQQVRNLPLNGRNFSQLIALQTGTVQSGNGIFFNGLSRDGVNITVDGTDASNPDRPSIEDAGGQTNQSLLSVEFISEFKSTSGVFSAETGRAISGGVNVITKSGTNEYHGSVYEFLRNDVLDARNFFAAGRDPLRLNQFGATLGGPIVRNKAFFFAGWEGVRQHRGRQVSGEVFSDSLREQIRTQNPALIPLVDLLPRGTQPLSDPTKSFHRRGDLDTNREDSGSARIDLNPNDKDRIFLRYSILDAYSTQAQLSPTNKLLYPSQNRTGTASWTRILSSRMLNELRAGVNKQDLPRTHEAFTLRGIPRLTGVFTTDLIKILRFNGGSWTVLDNFSYNAGRHSVKAGFELQRFHNGRSEFQNPIYRVDSVADLLARRFNNVIVTTGTDTRRIQESRWGFYVQDDFRFNSRITLNLGLRYEYFTPSSERDGFLFNVVGDPFGPFRPKGAAILNPDRNNFGPRLGLSWDLDGRSKNVIRAGAGVYYSPIASREMTAMVSPPDEPFRFTLTSREVGLPFPFDEAALVSNLKSLNIPTGVLAYETNARNTYSTQWMFTYQRELAANLALEVGYLGNRGLKLKDLAFLNEINPATGQRPVPPLGRIRYQEHSDMSVYHALQTSLRKRFSQSHQFNVHYTYGKSLSLGGVDDFTNQVNNQVQDPSNRRASRGRTIADLTHNLRLDYAADIAFDRWFGLSSGAPRKIAGGWQVMGITSARSGFPMLITSGRDNRGNGDSGPQRPDVAAGVPSKLDGWRESSAHRFLNRAAFTDPCDVRGLRRPCGVFGNLGKNVLSGPGAMNFDVSVIKNTKVTERFTVQFRTEFFNAFNLVNFGAPAAARLQITNTNFGEIATAANPREIQFALKLVF